MKTVVKMYSTLFPLNVANGILILLTIYSPVICNLSPHGAWDCRDIAELKCHVLASASSPQCCETAALLILCSNGCNFTFGCRDMSRDLTIKVSPAVSSICPGFAQRKVKIPAIPRPRRGSGYQCLVH